MKSYSILSPILGMADKVPSIFLKEAFAPDANNIFYHLGEVRSAKKRLYEWDAEMPDAIIKVIWFKRYSSETYRILAFTKRDIAYHDKNTDKFYFLTRTYKDATVISATENSGGTISIELDLPSGVDVEEVVKAGDCIRLSDKAFPYTSEDTWYEVLSVDSGSFITVEGVLPSGYVVPSGGDECAIRQTYAGEDNDIWSVIVDNETVLATNNGTDDIQFWDGDENHQAEALAMTDMFRCRRLLKYENRIIFIRTIEAGQEKPYRFRWSGLGDATDTGGSGSDAGSADIDEGEGRLETCVDYKGVMIAIKTKAIVKVWAVTGAEVFNKKIAVNGSGTNASESVIVDQDYVYFWDGGTNDFMRFDGIASRSFSENIDSFNKTFNPNIQKYIKAINIPDYEQVFWLVPYGTSEKNNVIVIYDKDEQAWSKMDMELESFCTYETQDMVDWASLPYTRWADWDWKDWIDSRALASFPIAIAGMANGRICRINSSSQDFGVDFTSYIVLDTDLGQKGALAYKKRITMLTLYCMKKVYGDFTIYAKADNEYAWRNLGTVSMISDNDITVVDLPIDLLGKSFKFKIASTAQFGFLGLMFQYEPVGLR